MKDQRAISVHLVDDDTLYLTTLMRYLKNKLGSEAHLETFTSGEDYLIEMSQNNSVDIVVLDYYLNGESKGAMNGLDVLKQIKNNNPETLVIMLTSKDKYEIAEACLRHGAYEYVVKSETAFIRTQNIIKNLIQDVNLQSLYPQDIGGEA